VEQRLAFYDKGVPPTKNITMMKAAIEEAGFGGAPKAAKPKKDKSEKKAKKEKRQAEKVEEVAEEAPAKKKKKKVAAGDE